jgi:phosphoglycerate kinase
MRFQKLGDLDVKGRRVFVRVDFNVPLDEQREITDDSRIRAAVPTIENLVERGAKVMLASHLGRPKKGPDDRLRLAPCARRLSALLGRPVAALRDCVGPEVEKALAAMHPGDVVLLENVRFYAEEERGDAPFAQRLRNGAELFVNDAFGTAHRAHASVTGVAALLAPQARAAGLLMEAELAALERLLTKVAKPYVAVLGGAKVSDKIRVVDHLLEKVDALLIGGGMAFTFLKAQGHRIGTSNFESESFAIAKAALEKAKARKAELLLPVDHVAAASFAESSPARPIDRVDLPDDLMGLDIGPRTIELFTKAIARAKTVVWNGPLGVFEWRSFAAGSQAIAESIAANRGTTVVGGGDSVAVIEKFGLAGRFTHVSTGGGAFLEALEGTVLPGVAALRIA